MNNFKFNPEIFKYKLSPRALQIYLYFLSNLDKKISNSEIKEKLFIRHAETLNFYLQELKIKGFISKNKKFITIY
jgi:predicted transcriptional regulator